MRGSLSVWRRAAGRILVVWLVAAWSVAFVATQEPKPDPAVEAARLAARNATLEALVSLASGKEFYLVLDPAKPDLALMLKGAELRRFPVQAMSVGVPRVGWVRRHEPRPWQGVVWEHGRLEPPREIGRVEITPPPPEGTEATDEVEAPAAPKIPPTPEEAYPVPLRYQIFFDGGPAIEIRPREADTSAGLWSRFGAWWHARWRDTVAALKSTPDDLVRLRVVLAPEDADSLYRSLPPDTKLLVLDNRPAGGEAPR
jgi:hypothetical protein